VNRFEMSQIVAVGVGAVGQALEAHEARKGSYSHSLTTEVDDFGAFGDGLVVQRRQASTHEIDDSVTAPDAQMVRTSDILKRERLVVEQSPSIHPIEETQYRGIRIRTIWDKQVTVLGGADVAMGDYGKAPDDHVFEADCVSVGDDAG
jgi:hypothetical protein